MLGFEQPSKMNFSKVRFWIKACDLPMNKKTYEFPEAMLSKFGDFANDDEHDVLAPTKYLKFHVDIDITKSLRHGMMVNVGGVPKWISFKYVKLPDFCYGYGRLGYRRRRGMEEEYKQEKCRLLELRDSGSGNGERSTLTLEVSLQSKLPTKPNSKMNKEHADMLVDEAAKRHSAQEALQ
ncbi:hypothetical protein Cgig2_016536 [Carnegiea gigantea]|uniref:DUF4283 domain-containing protein n=1 Tax=Carnegiea gigantea TaxID=171969 RepID=A0A9Q1Q9U7_9CARY|nr:hypothetical protein Cgig2_016536 [Carnegiea gigantea]